jgi:hypothetical protein
MTITNKAAISWLLFVWTLSVAFSSDVSEISDNSFHEFIFENLKNDQGIIIMPSSFINSYNKNDNKIQDLPKNILSQFDDKTSLVTHNVFMRVSKDFKTYRNAVLKNKSTIEKHLLYKSMIMPKENNDIDDCPLPISGVLESQLEIPKLLSMFSFPEKLVCDIHLWGSGIGKKSLGSYILKKLPDDLLDEDVHFINLNLSNCNMIFKAVAQRIYFVKDHKGKTLIIFDNYSLVKNSTIEKLDKVKGLIGSPVKFINSQVKKNMTGLLKKITSTP